MRGATILKASDDKTRALNKHTLMAFSGEAGDTSECFVLICFVWMGEDSKRREMRETRRGLSWSWAWDWSDAPLALRGPLPWRPRGG